MTAVEFLVKILNKQGFAKVITNFEIQKAQSLEDKRAIEFAKYCLDKAKDLDIITAFMNVEEYYERFKQQEQ
jgi:hypothetical protein